jgi:hypothetical protein
LPYEQECHVSVTINVGFSRKVGEPNFGSRGASLHLEVELDRTTFDDIERFQSEVEHVFERARQAVDQELQRETPRPAENRTVHDESPCPDSRNGNSPRIRPATANQLRAIERIAETRNVELSELLHSQFGGKDLEALSLGEASSLIDQLKSLPIPGELESGWAD